MGRLLLAVAAALLPIAAAGARGSPNPALLPAVSQSCQQCHDFGRGISHPVLVASDSRELPLERDGVSCLTCHDERTLTDEHAFVGGEQDPLLRASPSRLCASCHPGADPRSPLGHALELGRAHLDVGDSESGELDGETRWCLSCHDGSVAGGAAVRLGSSFGRSRPDQEHPVGVAYDEWGGRGARQLHAASGLPAEVRLFDQRLGCGSCHSLYSGLPDMLAVENHQGHMCLVCHVK